MTGIKKQRSEALTWTSFDTCVSNLIRNFFTHDLIKCWNFSEFFALSVLFALNQLVDKVFMWVVEIAGNDY